MKGLSPPPVGRQYIRDSCVKSHELNEDVTVHTEQMFTLRTVINLRNNESYFTYCLIFKSASVNSKL